LAVLVGIRDYAHLAPLVTPYQDVRALARMLRALKFEVHQIAEGSGPITSEAIRAKLINLKPIMAQMAATVDSADDDGCVLFYFAGHGVLHLDHIYLLDEEARTGEAAIRSHALSLDEILEDLAEVRDLPKIVLLDCCQTAAGAGAVPGLRLPRDLSYETVIGFATSAGRTAMDGAAQGHSPYATALCRHFPTQDALLSDIMSRVGGSVRELSSDAQNAVHLTTLCKPLMLARSLPAPARHGLANEPTWPTSPLSPASTPWSMSGESEALYVANNVHRIRACKFRDEEGRSAWYVVLLNEGAEHNFVASAARYGGIDLTSHGRILAREYGEVLSDNLCHYLESRFGVQVADRLRAVRARLRRSADALPGHGSQPPRSDP
jgi:hypothetical protein